MGKVNILVGKGDCQGNRQQVKNTTQYFVIIYKEKNLKNICITEYMHTHTHTHTHTHIYAFPGSSDGKESTGNVRNLGPIPR